MCPIFSKLHCRIPDPRTRVRIWASLLIGMAYLVRLRGTPDAIPRPYTAD